MDGSGSDDLSAPDPRRAVAPELRAALDIFPAFSFEGAGLAQARAGIAGMTRPPPSGAQAGVARAERWVPGAPGAPEVRLLVYTPPGAAAGPRPALLHIHGGGYVIGTADIADGANRTAALRHDCVVVSVDYRLAPDTPFPGALDDCYAALRWLHAEAEALGVDPARIAVAGESAGGGHAAALALAARDRGGPGIAFLLLDAPMLDDRTGSGATPHPHCGGFGWTAAQNRFGWRALLGAEPGGAAVPAHAVPARAASLAGLPPVFILVGALDLFLEEGMTFAARLSRAGVPIELHVIPGAYHGFGIAGPDAPQVRMTTDLRDAALARAFAGSFTK